MARTPCNCNMHPYCSAGLAYDSFNWGVPWPVLRFPRVTENCRERTHYKTSATLQISSFFSKQAHNVRIHSQAKRTARLAQDPGRRASRSRAGRHAPHPCACPCQAPSSPRSIATRLTPLCFGFEDLSGLGKRTVARLRLHFLKIWFPHQGATG